MVKREEIKEFLNRRYNMNKLNVKALGLTLGYCLG